MAEALEDLCFRAIKENDMKKPFLALVDHGTPVFEVHRVREEIGKALNERMKDYVSGFSTCSMERRDGEKYDFNEPLLENLLADKKECEEMLVAQLFLSPGRHAGKGGIWTKYVVRLPTRPHLTASSGPTSSGHIRWLSRSLPIELSKIKISG